MAQATCFQIPGGPMICIDLPEFANVFNNDSVLKTAGTGVSPAANKVLDDAGNFGPGAATVPTFDHNKIYTAADSTDPGIANVKSGTGYKINTASLQGTLNNSIIVVED
jgi:hypothetical protein